MVLAVRFVCVRSLNVAVRSEKMYAWRALRELHGWYVPCLPVYESVSVLSRLVRSKSDSFLGGQSRIAYLPKAANIAFDVARYPQVCHNVPHQQTVPNPEPSVGRMFMTCVP